MAYLPDKASVRPGLSAPPGCEDEVAIDDHPHRKPRADGEGRLDVEVALCDLLTGLTEAVAAALPIRALAQELVGLQPDIILTHSTPPTIALQRETRTIPIVFVNVSDPVGSGLVAELKQPGGNITGFGYLEPSLGGKWLELLSGIAPGLKRVAIMFNPDTAPVSVYMPSFETAARSLRVATIIAPVHDDVEIEMAIIALGREPGGGLVVMPDTFTVLHRAPIILAAARNNVPTVYTLSAFATDGGLLSYGVDPVDTFRRAATYVDRVLRGAKPSELPVQFPTKFELVINMKTAKALGLTIPQNLLALANEVID
jgi:putative tryptophan/tyrosine transport system substrate-binding protein